MGSATAAPPPIAIRLQVSVKLTEGGLVPETGVALSETELPAVTGFGVAVPVALGGVDELVTTREMLKLPLRPWSSDTVHGREYELAAVAAGTE